MDDIARHKPPICVDLDGTLLRTDVLSEALVDYLMQYPWRLFQLLVWFLKGRAYLKKKIADRIDLDISVLPVNQQIVDLIQQYKAHGHQILLVTAAPYKYGMAAGRHFDIFDDVMTSNENCNLRSGEKACALVKKFGDNQFCYMGNSGHDLPVWQQACHIIAINAPWWVLKKIWAFSKPYTILEEGLLSGQEILKLILIRLSRAELYKLAPIMLLSSAFEAIYLWYHHATTYKMLLKIVVLMLFFVVIRVGSALHAFCNIRRRQRMPKQPTVEEDKILDHSLSQALVRGQIPLGFVVQLALVCLISLVILSVWIGFK